MPRRTSETLDSIIQTSVAEVIRRVAPEIAAAIAQTAALKLETELATPTSRSSSAGRSGRRRRRRGDITKWVADRRARRVPNFVIEMTGGLDTKKKIVARYGENAAFEKGKPLPTTKDGKASTKLGRKKGRAKPRVQKTGESANATEPVGAPEEKRAL